MRYLSRKIVHIFLFFPYKYMRTHKTTAFETLAVSTSISVNTNLQILTESIHHICPDNGNTQFLIEKICKNEK